jgi:Eukaryotic cytochrome b561
VTLSGRFGTGHVEPTYSDMIDLSMVTPPSGPANMIEDGMLFVSGTCMNCTNLAMSTIDLTSTAQSFIFAVGEENRYPATMSKSGPLRRHAYYGTFTMDLTMATDMGGDDPISLHDMNENAMLTSFMKDHDIADPVHAFVLVLAFLVVFPSGVLSFRILKNVKLHMILQSIGLGLGVIGAASGFYLTTVYNRSKHFNSAHQIIGVLLVIALIGQWVAGFVNHRYYLKNRQPLMNGLPMKIHKRIMGPIILLVGLANGAIGFNFALANKWNYVYIPLCAAMLVVVAVVFFTRDIINRRIARTKRNPSIGAQAWYGEDHMTNRNMHGLNRIPSNPSMYDLNPVKPRDMT